MGIVPCLVVGPDDQAVLRDLRCERPKISPEWLPALPASPAGNGIGRCSPVSIDGAA